MGLKRGPTRVRDGVRNGNDAYRSPQRASLGRYRSCRYRCGSHHHQRCRRCAAPSAFACALRVRASCGTRAPFRPRRGLFAAIGFDRGQREHRSRIACRQRRRTASSGLADQDHDALSAVRANRGSKGKARSAFPVSEHAAGQSPTELGLGTGSSIQVEDAIRALVTKSANDAAVVITEAIGGDEGEFAKMMTRKAHALGMSRTTYPTPPDYPTTSRSPPRATRPCSAVPFRTVYRLLCIFRHAVLHVSW